MKIENVIATAAYPGSVTATYTYDSYGHRTGISVNGTTAWSLQSYNGLSTVEALGTQLTATSTLNSSGRLSSLRLAKGSVTLKQLTYSYGSTTGDLTNRTGMFSYGEQFSYDGVDRLASWTTATGTSSLARQLRADTRQPAELQPLQLLSEQSTEIRRPQRRVFH